MRNAARTAALIPAVVALVLSGADSARGAPMAISITVKYSKVVNDAAGQLNLSMGKVTSFGTGTTPMGVTAKPLEAKFLQTDPGHVDLFVPGNASMHTLTLTDGTKNVIFDILEGMGLPTRGPTSGTMHTQYINALAQLDPASPVTFDSIDLHNFVGKPETLQLIVTGTDVTYHISSKPTFKFTGTPAATLTLTPVPEPVSLLLWVAAGAGAVIARRRRRALPPRA